MLSQNLKPNQRAMLDLLVQISEWETRTVQVISRKMRLTPAKALELANKANNMTAQARAITHGASTEEERGAVLPRLRMEVDTLNIYAGSLREVLASQL